MPKPKKEREATPKAPKVSPASVDAPPAHQKKVETVAKSGHTPGQDPDLEANPDIPEELNAVWDDGIAKTFQAMPPKHQTFLLAYVKCWNAAASYRQSHNPLASDTVSSANGSRLVANDSISLILQKFANNKTEALFLVQKTYNDAAREATKPIFGKDDLGQPILVMEQPDYAVRVKAAEAIAKLHGLNQPAEVKHSGEIVSKVVQVQLPTKKKAE